MFDELPNYIEHEIEYDTGDIVAERFFFSVNRDIHGNWSAGYVSFASDDGSEIAIPELVTNNSCSLKEAEIRMTAKYGRYKKNHG